MTLTPEQVREALTGNGRDAYDCRMGAFCEFPTCDCRRKAGEPPEGTETHESKNGLHSRVETEGTETPGGISDDRLRELNKRGHEAALAFGTPSTRRRQRAERAEAKKRMRGTETERETLGNEGAGADSERTANPRQPDAHGGAETRLLPSPSAPSPLHGETDGDGDDETDYKERRRRWAIYAPHGRSMDEFEAELSTRTTPDPDVGAGWPTENEMARHEREAKDYASASVADDGDDPWHGWGRIKAHGRVVRAYAAGRSCRTTPDPAPPVSPNIRIIHDPDDEDPDEDDWWLQVRIPKNGEPCEGNWKFVGCFATKELAEQALAGLLPGATQPGDPRLSDDVLQTVGREGDTVDVGWHGGIFVCRVVRGYDWENPLERYETTDPIDVLGWLEAKTAKPANGKAGGARTARPGEPGKLRAMSKIETAKFLPCPFRDGWFLIVLPDDERIEATSAEWETIARSLERGMARTLEHVKLAPFNGAVHLDALSGPNKGLRLTLVGKQSRALAKQIRAVMIQTLMPRDNELKRVPN